MSNKNPKIKGILFKHSEDDYSIWMPDLAKNEEKKILQALVAAVKAVVLAAEQEENEKAAQPKPAPQRRNYKRQAVAKA